MSYETRFSYIYGWSPKNRADNSLTSILNSPYTKIYWVVFNLIFLLKKIFLCPTSSIPQFKKVFEIQNFKTKLFNFLSGDFRRRRYNRPHHSNVQSGYAYSKIELSRLKVFTIYSTLRGSFLYSGKQVFNLQTLFLKQVRVAQLVACRLAVLEI